VEPIMVASENDWMGTLKRWLEPFLDRLGHAKRRRMCPLYVAGLIGPGHRKSVQPMAELFAPGEYGRMHHFAASGTWDSVPLDLAARFAALRVRVADGPTQRIRDMSNQHMPGEEVWLISEQTHQQMKEELGLDHFEWAILDRSASTCTVDDDRLRVPAVMPPRGGGRGKESSAHPRGQACPPRQEGGPRPARITAARAMSALSQTAHAPPSAEVALGSTRRWNCHRDDTCV
jgi:hypothetical protein